MWFKLHRLDYLASVCRHRKDFLAIQNQHKTMGALLLIRAQPRKACTPIGRQASGRDGL